MRNLLRFILRYYAVFLFILLEFFAFLLIFQQNHYHNSVFFNSSNGIIGAIHKHVDAITDYINLKDDNEILLEENLQLKRTIERQKARSYSYINDMIIAEAINNTVVLQKNYITVNQGKSQGVKTQMGVVGPQGVVGIINNTSKHFATIIPIINTNFRLSAKFKKNNLYGSLSWDGKDIQTAQLNEIPSYVSVLVGDTIVTSGYSSSFAEGEMVGVVSKAVKSNANAFWNIQVDLSTDFRGVNELYIIKKPLLREQKELEAKND